MNICLYNHNASITTNTFHNYSLVLSLSLYLSISNCLVSFYSQFESGHKSTYALHLVVMALTCYLEESPLRPPILLLTYSCPI